MKIFFLLLLFAFPAVVHAQNPEPEKLAQEMGERITRIPEFEFIRQEAEKLGVRVYLFGGTAAAYGHYVRQDMAREAGDTRYPKEFYDYDYTNIFRSTQDLDVVIDGSAEKAKALEDLLKAKFPHFLGDKAAQWEVRPLREARGDKEAILGNANFQNQHTDSHSTGLVEVTRTPAGELPVKDVRDWNAKRPQFLEDVAQQKLHYYFNPLHETTKRARQGMNPPILSAIRYLTKAFQYDLEISGEDRERIQAIIKNFDPKSEETKYVEKWIEKNGKKLFQHAVDVEYAWKTLEDLGLRKKLLALHNDLRETDSLAWWMNKEPLRTQALGEGKGKTAAQIFGKDLVFAHETNSFLAFESITRSKAGELNGFISRSGGADEAAKYGEGFYALHGRTGARGTGITIRLELNPSAREGTDFTYNHDILVIKNKAAVRAIPEQISLSLPEYFRMLAEGKEFSGDDKALLETFRRKISRSPLVSQAEKDEVAQMVRDNYSPRAKALLQEWFRLPFSIDYPDIYERIEKYPGRDEDEILAKYVYSQPAFKGRLKQFTALINREQASLEAMEYCFSQPHWSGHPELLLKAIKSSLPDKYLKPALHPVVGLPQWVGHVDILKELLKKGGTDSLELVEEALLKQPGWADYPEIMEALLKKGYVKWDVPKILASPAWKNHPELVVELFKQRAARGVYNNGVDILFSSEQWKNNPDIFRAAIKYKAMDGWELAYILWRGGWDPNPDLVKALLKLNDRDTDHTICNILSKPGWEKYPEILREIIRRGHADEEVIEEVLSQAHWKNNPALQAIVGDEAVSLDSLKRAFAQGHTFKAMKQAKSCPAAFAEVSR